jgi:hypothetical protein
MLNDKIKALLARTTQRDERNQPTHEALTSALICCQHIMRWIENPTADEGGDGLPDPPVIIRKDSRDRFFSGAALKRFRWTEFESKYDLREVEVDERIEGCRCLGATCLGPAFRAGETVLTVRGHCIPGFPDRHGFTHLRCAQFWVDVLATSGANDFPDTDDDLPF